MLTNVAGVSQTFFDGLDSLIRNGVSFERVETALRLAEINLARLVSAARDLNKIHERQLFRLETAAQIASKMNRTDF
jgi:hypothetical protein